MCDRLRDLLNQVQDLNRTGDQAEADTLAKNAIDLAVDQMHMTLTTLGAIEADRGGPGLEIAVDLAEHSVVIQARLFGENDVRVGKALFILGKRLRSVGRCETAFDVWARAAKIYERVGETQFDRRVLLRRFWEVATELERFEVALDVATVFYDLTRFDADDDPYPEHARQMLGISLLNVGRTSEAVPLFEEVLAERKERDRQKQRPQSALTDEAERWLNQALNKPNA